MMWFGLGEVRSFAHECIDSLINHSTHQPSAARAKWDSCDRSSRSIKAVCRSLCRVIRRYIAKHARVSNYGPKALCIAKYVELYAYKY